jgi:hypothetical protein
MDGAAAPNLKRAQDRPPVAAAGHK